MLLSRQAAPPRPVAPERPRRRLAATLEASAGSVEATRSAAGRTAGSRSERCW